MNDLGNVPVPEVRYRADLELLAQYQGYSTEVARLSLLGIAALAFFLTDVVASEEAGEQFRDKLAGLLLGVSSGLFILATACALSHRYHSADGLRFHIKSIRLTDSGEAKAATETAAARNAIYRTAWRWLGAAVSLFGAGGFFFVAGFGRLIYLWATYVPDPPA